MTQLIKLPDEVSELFQLVTKLETKYPGRKFTPDGHLVGSIGEVIAASTFGLELYPASQPTHDAFTRDNRDVQIKLTGGKRIALSAEPELLLVMKIVSPIEAEVIYNGPGALPWASAGKMQKNGQRPLTLAKLRKLDELVSEKIRIV